MLQWVYVFGFVVVAKIVVTVGWFADIALTEDSSAFGYLVVEVGVFAQFEVVIVAQM